MSSQTDSISIKSLPAMQRYFSESVARLNYSDYKVKISENEFPVHALSHPHVMLPWLAYRADAISMVLVGARLFEDAFYIADKSKPSGISILAERQLNEEQKDSIGSKTTSDARTVDSSIVTKGLVRLMIDLSVEQSISIDHDTKTITPNILDLDLQLGIDQAARYEDGQCIPLLSAPLLALSGLQHALKSDIAMEALNAAKKKAAELDRARENSIDIEHT